ncbi:MAG: SEC-C metal-binding domain-containing protein [Burkholderiales bacterium]
MTEHLGAVLHKDDYWSDDLGVGEWWLRHHAVMILGLIPSESAGRLLVEFLRRINEAEDDDLQDWLLGSWPALFRNKPDAVLQQVRDLAEDRSYDDFTRVEAINAAIACAARPGSQWPLDEALDWAAAIAFSADEALDVRLLVGDTLLDFARPEYRSRLEGVADLQPRIARVFGRDDIERVYAIGGEPPEWERLADPCAFYTPEALEEREREQTRVEERFLEEDGDVFSDEPYVRPTPKIGRNDPCPCGSGKKYKKCCLSKDR